MYASVIVCECARAHVRMESDRTHQSNVAGKAAAAAVAVFRGQPRVVHTSTALAALPMHLLRAR